MFQPTVCFADTSLTKGGKGDRLLRWHLHLQREANRNNFVDIHLTKGGIWELLHWHSSYKQRHRRITLLTSHLTKGALVGNNLAGIFTTKVDYGAGSLASLTWPMEGNLQDIKSGLMSYYVDAYLINGVSMH